MVMLESIGRNKMPYNKCLSCPYCPAQAYVKPLDIILWVGGYKAFQPIVMYECPSKHKFYVEMEK